MIIEIIVFIIAVLICFWLYVGGKGIGLSILMSASIFVFISIINMMVDEGYISMNSSEFVYKPVIEVNRVNIKTIQDKTGEISGRFCLGSGVINSNSYYYFYVSENDSTSYLKKLNSDYVKIIETDSQNPCVVKYRKEIDWENTPQANWVCHSKQQSVRYNWVIYVPKNTIIINYSLDGQ